jgi:hypothetical protein
MVNARKCAHESLLQTIFSIFVLPPNYKTAVE